MGIGGAWQRWTRGSPRRRASECDVVSEISINGPACSRDSILRTLRSTYTLRSHACSNPFRNAQGLIARDGLKVRRLIVSCRKLLSERGEAAGVSLAKITLDLYRELDAKEQARFFAALLSRVLARSSAGARRLRRRTLRSRRPRICRSSASPPSRRARSCSGGSTGRPEAPARSCACASGCWN